MCDSKDVVGKEKEGMMREKLKMASLEIGLVGRGDVIKRLHLTTKRWLPKPFSFVLLEVPQELATLILTLFILPDRLSRFFHWTTGHRQTNSV